MVGAVAPQIARTQARTPAVGRGASLQGGHTSCAANFKGELQIHRWCAPGRVSAPADATGKSAGGHQSATGSQSSGRTRREMTRVRSGTSTSRVTRRGRGRGS
ncbi:hypothetical protein ACJJTC_003575 [Scirpophaga incertulas]